MKKQNILLLVREGLEPPASAGPMSDAELFAAEWKTEFDVCATLRELGHNVRVLGLYDDLTPIRRAIEEDPPDVAFNMLEEFHGMSAFEAHVVSYLELLRLPYTGCNPLGLMLARDKALCKDLLLHHRVRTPKFAVFPAGRRGVRPRWLEFPLFVKSVGEDASLGISQASIVRDDRGLADRVAFIHDSVRTDAMVEQYIEGRELYVAVMGNKRLDVFPVWELLIKKRPGNAPMIATGKVKWDAAYQEKMGVDSRAARGLSEPQRRGIKKLCKRIYRILRLSGCARIDFRLAPDGELHFLEANPNPQLAYGEDFAESAHQAGVIYERLLERFLRLAHDWHAQQAV